MSAPLAGIRVVEVAGWMAAPGATAMMADMGAEVIKVEPLTGDPMRGATRRPDPAAGARVDPGFQTDNRGKRGIAVAIDTERGAEVVRRPVACRSKVTSSISRLLAPIRLVGLAALSVETAK